MDNPQQVLLHLTSRGSKVRTQADGGIGSFQNLTTQPINNINKYGLLHYSIPKTLDLISDENRTFNIRITFSDDIHVTFPVTLPTMDYYNMTLDSTQVGQIAFTEVLQTSINWAIQEYWTKNKATFMAGIHIHRGLEVCNRLGCIVNLTPMGRLQFIFGWRGERPITNNGVAPAVMYSAWGAGPVAANSGCPTHCVAEANIDSRIFHGVTATPNDLYAFIDTSGAFIDQNPNDLTEQHAAEQSQLKRVSFTGLSSRLQFLFGSPVANPTMPGLAWLQDDTWVNTTTGVAPAANANKDALYRERGRIILVNYASPYSVGGNNVRLGLIALEMTIAPNMYAPSFMFLQLTAQGTKSKVLGHNAERGGWAVPTASNQFKSKWDNFPGFDAHSINHTYAYDAYQVRQAPCLLNVAPLDRAAREGFIAEKDVPANGGGDLPPSLLHDQLPLMADSVIANSPGGNAIAEIRNFSLVRDHTLPAPAGDYKTNHRFGSRMIHYGDLNLKSAMAEKKPRQEKQFGLSVVREAPTFTVSMIDPNWIYTDVPNSTVQSLDILLMWGDTNKNVTDTSAFPVQFTLIASQ